MYIPLEMSQAMFWAWFNYSSRIKNLNALIQPNETHKLSIIIKTRNNGDNYHKTKKVIQATILGVFWGLLGLFLHCLGFGVF